MSYEFFCNKIGCGGEITYGSLAIGVIGLLIMGVLIYFLFFSKSFNRFSKFFLSQTCVLFFY